jgi:hypothetical protein
VLRLLSAPRVNEQQTFVEWRGHDLQAWCCTFLSGSHRAHSEMIRTRLFILGLGRRQRAQQIHPRSQPRRLSALGIVEPERQAPCLTTAIAPLCRCHSSGSQHCLRETIGFLAALYSDQCVSCSTPRGHRLALDTHPTIAVVACMASRLKEVDACDRLMVSLMVPTWMLSLMMAG